MLLLLLLLALFVEIVGYTVDVDELVIDGLTVDGIAIFTFVLMGAKVVLGTVEVVSVEIDCGRSGLIELLERSIKDELEEFKTVLSASSNI